MEKLAFESWCVRAVALVTEGLEAWQAYEFDAQVRRQTVFALSEDGQTRTVTGSRYVASVIDYSCISEPCTVAYAPGATEDEACDALMALLVARVERQRRADIHAGNAA